MDTLLRLPFRTMRNRKAFTIESPDDLSISATLTDFYKRRRTQHWNIAIVSEQKGVGRTIRNPHVCAGSYGLMLLNYYPSAQVIDGVYYPAGDCGADTPEAQMTAEILTTLNPRLNKEHFYHGFLVIYTRIILLNMGTYQLDYFPM